LRRYRGECEVVAQAVFVLTELKREVDLRLDRPCGGDAVPTFVQHGHVVNSLRLHVDKKDFLATFKSHADSFWLPRCVGGEQMGESDFMRLCVLIAQGINGVKVLDSVLPNLQPVLTLVKAPTRSEPVLLNRGHGWVVGVREADIETER